MNNRLEDAKDWRLRAKRAGYRVETVARQLGISIRWFEVKFKARFGKTPHTLFAKWRRHEIRMHVEDGKYGKEMLEEVGFSHCSSLTRSLTRDGKLGLRELNKDRDCRADLDLVRRQTVTNAAARSLGASAQP